MSLPDLHTDADWLPLTDAQLGIYLAHELDPSSAAYTTAEVVVFDDVIDAERLRTALAAAYDEFEQLRTRYRITDSGPQQCVIEGRDITLATEHAADMDAAHALIDAHIAVPLDLAVGETTRSGVVRIDDGPGGAHDVWWHAAHHVVLDGYGVQQLLRRVAELYDGAGPMPVEERVALRDLVADAHGAADARAAWDARLEPMREPASLAGRIAVPAPRARRVSQVIDAELQTALATHARALGTTWADLFTAAAGTYVARALGISAGRIGLPLMNRTLPGVGQLVAARTVCTAINVVPATIDASSTVADAIAATRAEQAALRAHPFERQEALARRLHRLHEVELFGMQVNVIPVALELSVEQGVVTGTVQNITAGPVEDLTLTMRGAPGRGREVRHELDAHPDLYSAEQLDLHCARLLHWLRTWTQIDAAHPVTDITFPTPEELDLTTRVFNDTAVERESQTLGQRFLTQAHASPDATALHFDGVQRTYAQLLERAQAIAGGLATRGVGMGDVVGLQLERSFELYEAIHALALLGAVYLPLDLDVPDARLENMLADADCQVRLRADDIEPLAAAGAAQPLLSAPPADVDAPAYLLFTSGSTGRPKGVLVSHRAIDNRLAWMQHHIALAPNERVLHKTPISFDVSIWELYWPLQVGASVVIAPPGAHRDPRAIAELVTREQITVLHFVPSMLRALLADRPSRDTVRESAHTVRALVASGEALTPDLVAGSLEHFAVAPINLYGPTEAAVDVTVWDCTSADADERASVPIGRPVWNTSCYVLDAQQRPVGVGMVGELWLGGGQLAIGYAGRDDLTAERFVETPFGRLYRTGDLASWRADGALEYHGRTDDQIKVRGQRVELGELEAVLGATPGVSSVVAGVHNEQLVAWFVPEGSTEVGQADVLIERLRATAQDALPPAWVPASWVCVDAVPTTTSGKVDRRALAAQAPPTTGADVVAGDEIIPASLVEERIASIMAELLGQHVVPVGVDFFALGGDSLTVLHLVGRIEEEFGVAIGLADAFAHPTAQSLAELVSSGGGTAVRGDDFAELLTLRTGGPNPRATPLFLLAPAGGLGWCYTALLAGLPPDLPVHAIQAAGLASGAPVPLETLDALAARQLEVIRSVVGQGGFHVAGWSLGGMAAHAVAAHAQAAGQRVGAVVLLDAYPVEQWHDLPDPSEGDALIGILRLAGIAEPADGALTRARVLDMLRASGSALAHVPDIVIDGCRASVRDAARIMRVSESPRYAGAVTLVVADAPRAETHLDAEGWRSHVGGELRVARFDATHESLVRRPHAGGVAQEIAEAIEAADAVTRA